MGIPIADLASGLFLAIGILSALHERERAGQGQWVQTSLLEAMIAMLDFQATRFTIDGEVPGPAGNDHPTVVPMGCFATADGYINVAGGSGRMLQRFCRAIDLPEILDDPRFATGALRSANRRQLNELIGDRLATEDTETWVRRLNQAGVAAGPVNSIDAMFADPQVRHLAMVQSVEHGQLGRLDLVRHPVSMSRTHPARGHVRPGTGGAHRCHAGRAWHLTRRDRAAAPAGRGLTNEGQMFDISRPMNGADLSPPALTNCRPGSTTASGSWFQRSGPPQRHVIGDVRRHRPPCSTPSGNGRMSPSWS